MKKEFPISRMFFRERNEFIYNLLPHNANDDQVMHEINQKRTQINVTIY